MKEEQTADSLVRGYVTKVGDRLEGKNRYYFVLHSSSITWHVDHEHTGTVHGEMKLTGSVSFSANDMNNSMDLLEHATNNVLSLSFEKNTLEYTSWKNGVANVLKQFEEVEEETLQRIENAYDSAVMQGSLKVRPAKGGDDWVEHNFILTMNELLVLKNNMSGEEILEHYDIFPSCSVFETNLGQLTFEFVTPRKVLHLMSDTRDVMAAWIDNFRYAISESEPDQTDPILQMAMAKIEDDVFYDVSFHDAGQPLGVVLERSGEWAIVKQSKSPKLGISVGSALSSINGESCVLLSHERTIGKLKNWKPPLNLGFRRPPKKSGFLVKLTCRKDGTYNNLKKFYFCLDDGRLVYKDDDQPSRKVRGGLPMKGSAVSLVSPSETGVLCCFRVVCGVTSLDLQGESQEDMIDWAATLYHAIAIANGGGHIVCLERKRLVNESEAYNDQSTPVSEVSVNALGTEAIVVDLCDEESTITTTSVNVTDVDAAKVELAKEEERARAQAEADLLMKQEQEDRRVAQESLSNILESSMSVTSLDELKSALAVAVSFGDIDENLLNEARSKVSTLSLVQQNLEDVRNMLLLAITSESVASLDEALEHASRIEYCGEEVVQVKEKLQKLREESEDQDRQVLVKQNLEDVRNMLLLAITSESVTSLDEALEHASRIEYCGEEVVQVKEKLQKLREESEDQDRQVNGTVLQDVLPNSERARLRKVVSNAGSRESETTHAPIDRKLSNVRDRVEEDERARKLAETQTLTTDEQLARFFKRYARIIDGYELKEPLLTPVQFSSLLRQVTGEKGNLFSEMKTFNG
jgi:hypothetical protein